MPLASHNLLVLPPRSKFHPEWHLGFSRIHDCDLTETFLDDFQRLKDMALIKLLSDLLKSNCVLS